MKTNIIKYIFIFVTASFLLIGCAKDIVDSTGTVFGKVTDSKTGEPLRNAYVSLTPSGKSTVTGEDGTYDFKDVEPAQYDLQIKKDGYQTNTKKIMVIAGQISSADAVLIAIPKESHIQLDVSSLNFGSFATSLSFNIGNIGNTGAINWTISQPDDATWIAAITPKNGTTDMNKSSAVVVTLNRKLIQSDLSATIMVNAEGESIPLQITATKTNTVVGLDLDIKSKSVSAQASEFYVMVTSNSSWSTSDVPNWVTLTPSSGSGNVTVKVSVSKNNETTSRSAAIYFRAGASSSQVLNISQSGGDAQIQLDVTHKDLTDQSGTFNVNVTTNGAAWSTTGIPNWITASPISGTGNMQVVLSYQENNTGQDRSATIVFTSGTHTCNIVVSQAKKAPEEIINIVPNGLFAYYPFDGNTKNIMFEGLNGLAEKTTFTTGVKAGNAISFSSVNESKVHIANGLIDAKASSISFWIKDISDGHIFSVLTSGSDPIGFRRAFFMEMRNGRLRSIIKRYNVGYQYDKVESFMHPSLTDGKWHHVVLTVAFGEDKFGEIRLKLYIDGEHFSDVTEDYNPFDSDNYGLGTGFTLGGPIAIGSSRKINGASMKVDNLRIYNSRRINATEVRAIYNGEK